MPRNEEKKAFMGIGRLCVVLVIALLLAWFLLPVFRGIVNIGNAAGILLCSFALWLAGYPGAAGCLSSLWGHPGGKVLLSAASLALGVSRWFTGQKRCRWRYSGGRSWRDGNCRVFTTTGRRRQQCSRSKNGGIGR